MELTRDEEQRRLRDAAKCEKCKNIWASYSNQFCGRHQERNWKLREQRGLSENHPSSTPPSSNDSESKLSASEPHAQLNDRLSASTQNLPETSTEPVTKQPNAGSRLNSPEALARDLGISDDQVRRALQVLGIKVPRKFASFQHNAGGVPMSDADRARIGQELSPGWTAAEPEVPTATPGTFDLTRFEDQQFQKISIATEFGKFMRSATFHRCTLKDVDFRDVDLSATKFHDSRLENCIFSDSALSNSAFENSIVLQCQFDWARLEGASFKGSEVSSNFMNARLIDAEFQEARLRGSDLSGALLIGAKFDGADIRGANLVRANTQAARLENAIFDSGQLTSLQIDSSKTPRQRIDPYQRQHLNVDGTGKRVYLSLDEATLAAARMQELGDHGMNAYECDICRNFHIAHS